MRKKSVPERTPPYWLPLKKKGPIERLLESPAFASGPRADALFVAGLREAFSVQARKSAFLRAYLELEGWKPSALRAGRDVVRAPFVFVSALKERDLTTIKPSEMVLELKSSGTTGQRSRMQLDEDSHLRVRRMAWKVFEGLGLTDLERPHDYICFTYDPAVAKDLGTAWTDKLLAGFTRQGELFWAFRWDRAKKDFYFDLDGAVEALARFEEKGSLVRLVGFPAFALKLTEEFKKRRGRFPRLNPGSSVVTGGGWKTLQDEAIDKKQYRRILADSLGIPADNVRDLFGMVEHGVPYVDCRLGNFHVPNYGRVIARDPGTLEPLPYGRTGLLQFIAPYLTSYPSLSLLSSDTGRVLAGCRCGLPGNVLEIKGRAGVKKLKGCAISAATML
ncbi:MAG: hypothetical protein RQ748_01125 [Elusimicrobiales bacterium]|nr:hypothetical protein [Elusimicrobiales bacterium]